MSTNNVDTQYTPSARKGDVAILYGNHFKWMIDGSPDLTFFAQSVTLPSITSGPVGRPTPFVRIPEVGDHIVFGDLNVTYQIDNAFKTYFSLFAWMRGYGHPTSYQEILDFNASRRNILARPNPQPRDIQKTTATLLVLQPDNDSSVAEIFFEDVFPIGLGRLAFETTPAEPPVLTCTVNFAYTDFQVNPKTP